MDAVLILGILANVVCFCGGFYQNPRYTIISSVAGSTIYAVYSWYLSLYSPLAIHILNVVVAICLLKFSSPLFKKQIAIVVALIVTVYLGFNFASEYDIFLIAAAWSMGFSRYCMENNILFKLGILGSQILWITYSIIFNDYAMIVTCSFIMASNGYSLFKILSIQNINRECEIKIV